MSAKNARIRKKIANKRFLRKVRSSLKKKIRLGGKISVSSRRRYNIASVTRKIDERKTKPFYIQIPEKFCFLADHESSIRFLKDLRQDLLSIRNRDLFISHTSTRLIGLGASFAFDYMIEEYLNTHRKKRKKINISGQISSFKGVNNFLLAFGLFKILKVKIDKKSGLYDLDYLNKYISFKSEFEVNVDNRKAQASTELVKYFDKCLRHNGKSIDDKTRATLIDAFGELLGNAEEHCGESKPRWFVRGCYEKESHTCKFAIINFGNSIYESMSHPDSTCRNAVEKFVNRYERKNGKNKLIESAMRILSMNKDENEPLWNLMAIQEGISSKRSASGLKRSTRGHGLMDVIEYLDSVREESKDAEMAIISGGSKLLIDFRYPIVKIKLKDDFRRMIAFNKDGQLSNLHDLNCLVKLEHKFEGTVVTGKFQIKESLLTKENGKKD